MTRPRKHNRHLPALRLVPRLGPLPAEDRYINSPLAFRSASEISFRSSFNNSIDCSTELSIEGFAGETYSLIASGTTGAGGHDAATCLGSSNPQLLVSKLKISSEADDIKAVRFIGLLLCAFVIGNCPGGLGVLNHGKGFSLGYVGVVGFGFNVHPVEERAAKCGQADGDQPGVKQRAEPAGKRGEETKYEAHTNLNPLSVFTTCPCAAPIVIHTLSQALRAAWSFSKRSWKAFRDSTTVSGRS